MQKEKMKWNFFLVNLQEKKIVLNYKQKIFKKKRSTSPCSSDGSSVWLLTIRSVVRSHSRAFFFGHEKKVN
jgi:hypothetical protein